MAALTNRKHELFAQGLAKGLPASRSYTEAGYKPSEAHASRLAANGKVKARVAELIERAAVRAEITAADVVEMLREDRELARNVEQPGAAVSASMGIAKLLGLIIEKREHSGSVGVRHEDALNALR